MVDAQARPTIDRDLANLSKRVGWVKRSGARATLAPEMLAGMVSLVVICVIVGSGAAAFALYLGITMHAAAEVERYFLTLLVAAALFVAGFQYIEGYALRQLYLLRWQLTRVAATWAITLSLL